MHQLESLWCPVGAVAMLASVGFLVVLAAMEGLFRSPLRFDTNGWLSIGFIGVSSGIGYYLWLCALNHTTPTRVTVFLSLSPITATALGGLWLAETVSIWLIVGVACVALGLLLAHWQDSSGPFD